MNIISLGPLLRVSQCCVQVVSRAVSFYEAWGPLPSSCGDWKSSVSVQPSHEVITDLVYQFYCDFKYM